MLKRVRVGLYNTHTKVTSLIQCKGSFPRAWPASPFILQKIKGERSEQRGEGPHYYQEREARSGACLLDLGYIQGKIDSKTHGALQGTQSPQMLKGDKDLPPQLTERESLPLELTS